MKRFFIAINFSKELKSKFALFQKELQNYLPSTKWVSPKNIHLTLVFLGQMKEEKQEQILKILKQSLEKTEPFYLYIKGIGVFPKPQRAKVLWLKTEGEILKLLNQVLHRHLIKAGFLIDEREFQAHITLARFKNQISKDAILIVLEKFKEIDFGKMEVKSIEFMESVLSKEGPKYTKIKSINLD